MTRRHYRFQVQGPNADQILNKINGGPTCLRSIDAVLAVNAQQRYDSVKPIRKLPSDYTQDLLSGEIMVGFLPVHVAQGFVNSGRLTALAVGSPKRHPLAPTVATIEELGGKGVDVDMWYAFFAPGKTPAAVLGRLNTEIGAIRKLPEVRELLGRAGFDAAAFTPAELSAVVTKDFPRWGAVIKRNGISAE